MATVALHSGVAQLSPGVKPPGIREENVILLLDMASSRCTI